VRGSTVPGSPVRGSTEPGSPVRGSPVPGSTVPGSTVLGSTVLGSVVGGWVGSGARSVVTDCPSSAPSPSLAHRSSSAGPVRRRCCRPSRYDPERRRRFRSPAPLRCAPGRWRPFRGPKLRRPFDRPGCRGPQGRGPSRREQLGSADRSPPRRQLPLATDVRSSRPPSPQRAPGLAVTERSHRPRPVAPRQRCSWWGRGPLTRGQPRRNLALSDSADVDAVGDHRAWIAHSSQFTWNASPASRPRAPRGSPRAAGPGRHAWSRADRADGGGLVAEVEVAGPPHHSSISVPVTRPLPPRPWCRRSPRRTTSVIGASFEGGITTDWIVPPATAEGHLTDASRELFVRLVEGVSIDQVQPELERIAARAPATDVRVVPSSWKRSSPRTRATSAS
jgi:hypothetical protein